MTLALPVETLTAQTPSSEEVTDELGNPIPGSGAAGPVTFRGCIVPSRTGEVREVAGRTQVVTMYRIYADGAVMLSASSRILWRGLSLEVQGDPEFWPDGLGGIDHTEALALIAHG